MSISAALTNTAPVIVLDACTVAAKPSQPDSRQDGVAWHKESGTLYFLEFTRAWDEGDSLREAEACKGELYAAAAEQAVCQPALEISDQEGRHPPFCLQGMGVSAVQDPQQEPLRA
eukprot:1584952-Rhodomonas_salina.2